MEFTVRFDNIEASTDKAVLFGFQLKKKLYHEVWLPLSQIEVDNKKKHVHMNKWLFNRMKDTKVEGASPPKQYFISYIERFIVDKSNCVFPKIDFDPDLEDLIAL